jgi:hypothetical protein
LDEKTRSWFVVLVFVAIVVAGYLLFLRPYLTQEPELDRVLKAKSTWTVTMQEYKQTGPISQETYRIANDNGASKMYYAATNQDGTLTKWFEVPISGPTPTFLFQELGVDGIWDLDSKPVRPRSTDQYIVEVDQTLGDEGGSRAFGFSDPKYWATTKAEEFQLRLPAKSMHGLNLSHIASAGRSLRDPHYLRIVQEIESFGPSSVLEAQNKIRAELRATPTQASVKAALKKGH